LFGLNSKPAKDALISPCAIRPHSQPTSSKSSNLAKLKNLFGKLAAGTRKQLVSRARLLGLLEEAA